MSDPHRAIHFVVGGEVGQGERNSETASRHRPVLLNLPCPDTTSVGQR